MKLSNFFEDVSLATLKKAVKPYENDKERYVTILELIVDFLRNKSKLTNADFVKYFSQIKNVKSQSDIARVRDEFFKDPDRLHRPEKMYPKGDKVEPIPPASKLSKTKKISPLSYRKKKDWNPASYGPKQTVSKPIPSLASLAGSYGNNKR